MLWVVSGNKKASYISGGGNYVRTRSDWDEWNIKLYALKNGKLEMIRDFGKEVAQSVKRAKPPMYWRQRLYVNHKTGKLFVGEQVTDLGKSFSEILEIDPDTGGIRKVKLPFDAEDLAFDMEGHIYLRSRYELVRYNPVTWREVPFDYGEERTQIAYNSSSRARADVISAIPLYTGTLWHKGGLWVNPKGHIVISCYATKDLMPHYEKRTDAKMIGGGSPPGKNEKHVKGNVFVPRFFPGRNYYGEIHIYDKHGVSIHKDQVPGIAIIDGLFIDQDDSVYCMAGSTRVLDGKKYFSDFTGTLMKFKLNKGRVITAGKGRQPVVLPKGDEPKRPHDIIGTVQGHAWVKDAEWFYGGVGYAGRAAGSHRMGGATCACYNTRFTMDYFNRSFAPEFDRYSVAVLDSNGNLILRIGKYGNVDNGIPLIPESGIRNPVSVGGDEVALFYACYVAAHTDKRLFIADAGNARILSVKLGYHSEEKVALKDVK